MKRLAGAVSILALAALTACNGGGSAGPSPTPTPGGPLLYVADAGNNAIFEFARQSTGVALPFTTISGPATLLQNPYPIAVDPSGNIWVGDHGSPPTVLEFSSSANGNAAPVAIMTVSSVAVPGAQGVSGMVFDAAGHLYVATGTNNHLLVYNSPGNGSPTPSQDISGLNTQLNDALGIALDGSGNIFTASSGSNAILEFAHGATGNASPVRVIQGFVNTHLNAPSYVAVDSAGDVFALNAGDGLLHEYAPNASGDAAPIATLALPDMAGQIIFDSNGNLYIGALDRSPGAVLVYAPPISSGSKPVQMLQSPVLGVPTGVFAR